MSDRHDYTALHPRWYRPRISTWWWLRGRHNLAFVAREVSSVFVAWFVVFFLVLVRAVSLGEDNYQAFLTWAANPGIVLLNAVSLLFVVFHAVTWFNLAPQAMQVRLRGKRVPGVVIAGSNYAAWALVTGFVAWTILGG
jgi:fumarate reductase subunit C